ncbi:hypothetical protein BDR04DRAFT_1095235 [Suillus decipiens]|nr:hypothetical protein BDR04DRAFT_1095235 [Suillus decipiens]
MRLLHYDAIPTFRHYSSCLFSPVLRITVLISAVCWRSSFNLSHGPSCANGRKMKNWQQLSGQNWRKWLHKIADEAVLREDRDWNMCDTTNGTVAALFFLFKYCLLLVIALSPS